jgi:hypothetical protein
MFTVLTICAAEYAKAKEKSAANAVIVMIFLYYVCYNIAWSRLLVGYGVEILPYRVRAKVPHVSLNQSRRILTYWLRD